MARRLCLHARRVHQVLGESTTGVLSLPGQAFAAVMTASVSQSPALSGSLRLPHQWTSGAPRPFSSGATSSILGVGSGTNHACMAGMVRKESRNFSTSVSASASVEHVASPAVAALHREMQETMESKKTPRRSLLSELLESIETPADVALARSALHALRNHKALRGQLHNLPGSATVLWTRACLQADVVEQALQALTPRNHLGLSPTPEAAAAVLEWAIQRREQRVVDAVYREIRDGSFRPTARTAELLLRCARELGNTDEESRLAMEFENNGLKMSQ